LILQEKVPAVAGIFLFFFTASLGVVLEDTPFFVWCFRGEVVVDSW
jgi:hypothetical protein